MSEEEIALDDNMEIIEEDFIVEETSEPIYTVDIKQEHDFQSEKILIYDECEQHGYKIPLENGEDRNSNKQSSEVISQNENITSMQSNPVKLETTDIGRIH